MISPHFADRLREIEPFHVMDVLARARELEAAGKSIIHMEIGEPDFVTAEGIVQAGIEALQQGHTHYTPAQGLPALRQAIAASYQGLEIDSGRVVVTPGASGALQLIFAALVNPGDEVLMADPGYPCNRHFVRLFEGQPVSVPVFAETRYQLTADLIRQHWTSRTVAVLLASPSNPTGAIVSESELVAIIKTVDELGGVLVMDEIYHGLVYDEPVKSVLSYSPNAFVVNSFSKFYGMTGWRVGWLVVPEPYISSIDKLAQNLFIASPTVGQYAALAAFDSDVQQELLDRRDIFRERRDYLLPALRRLGFRIPVTPQGAFYLYADSSALTGNSQQFANELLESGGVAITPGRDFGQNLAEQSVRFSYANTLENLKEGVRRIEAYLSNTTA
ncbi:MAG: pyridoxal phosphate-dependent aminotransferase [Gammaproteobacteria bacterium]|nr:MAG: pyridoxal phosphate-dependent aminotransferase [Gammaproteobacteria bacterium]